MKNVSRTFIASAILGSSLLAAPAFAEQKIAIVDVQGIFQALPQAAEISAAIQAEFKTQIEEVQQLQKDGQFYAERLQRDAATMNEAEKKEIQDKILDVRRQLSEKAQPLEQNIQRRSQEEQNKLLALISQSIDAVSEKENYDIVLNAGAAVFVKDNHDISKQVLEQLNK
ncbi:OmpH family outer membrane protein [Alteromonas sp. 5E99-2]|uniref:OmpH family outer membrane protein n=1 Tax=Alteromonas sp. 5E99-2 TaxID=2817683 RepID=UPI001A9A0744|nr:OmpH family outer membrane protein [Alteromonas sp. 5E99-2]MBO1254094.1 OmpH family outer membrane protein [Alteromonas sp. 5E99-2]